MRAHKSWWELLSSHCPPLLTQSLLWTSTWSFDFVLTKYFSSSNDIDFSSWFRSGPWHLLKGQLECSRWNSRALFLDWRHNNVQFWYGTGSTRSTQGFQGTEDSKTIEVSVQNDLHWSKHHNRILSPHQLYIFKGVISLYERGGGVVYFRWRN